MTSQIGNRRRFVAGLAGIPIALADPVGSPPRRWRPTRRPPPVVPADQGLQMLIEGNKRFVAGNLTSLSNLAQDREQVTTGQSPIAVVVCCSDSRVPPDSCSIRRWANSS